LIDGEILDAPAQELPGDGEVRAFVRVPAGIVGVIGEAEVSGEGEDEEEGGKNPANPFHPLTKRPSVQSGFALVQR